MQTAINSSLEQQKQRRKTEYLYAQIYNVGAGNIIAASLLVIIYWNQLNNAVLVGWLAAVLCVTAHRFYVAAAFRRRDRYASASHKWYKIYANGALVKGCLWGAISVYLAHQASAQQLPYLLMILGGLVACTSITNSSLFTVYVRFATPALVAPGLYLITQFSSDKFMIGALVLCWFALMYSAAWRFNKFVAKSLGFEFENIALLTELEANRTHIARLEKKARWQEKIINDLQESLDVPPLRCAPGSGARGTAQEKSGLKLAKTNT